jgi:hypothetical protein
VEGGKGERLHGRARKPCRTTVTRAVPLSARVSSFGASSPAKGHKGSSCRFSPGLVREGRDGCRHLRRYAALSAVCARTRATAVRRGPAGCQGACLLIKAEVDHGDRISHNQLRVLHATACVAHVGRPAPRVQPESSQRATLLKLSKRNSERARRGPRCLSSPCLPDSTISAFARRSLNAVLAAPMKIGATDGKY